VTRYTYRIKVLTVVHKDTYLQMIYAENLKDTHMYVQMIYAESLQILMIYIHELTISREEDKKYF